MMAAQQPQPMMQPAMQPQMMQPMQQAMAPVAAPQTDSKLMGLQPTATGQFALVPLAPEAPLGGFSMASSLAYGPGTNQLNMQQYQELQRLAAQYKMQPGRVRVVSYGNEQDPQILGRATSTAAYLVDMGVPANAIRLKIEATAPVGPQNKTDIFLETMPAR
jgi:outer membrane protein OmpA-like peptidoglycan-associated protein